MCCMKNAVLGVWGRNTLFVHFFESRNCALVLFYLTGWTVQQISTSLYYFITIWCILYYDAAHWESVLIIFSFSFLFIFCCMHTITQTEEQVSVMAVLMSHTFTIWVPDLHQIFHSFSLSSTFLLITFLLVSFTLFGSWMLEAQYND